MSTGDGSAWGIYVCPNCRSWTGDTDHIECDCDVEEWNEVTVVPASELQAVREQLERVREAMDCALDQLTDFGRSDGEAVQAAIATLREALADPVPGEDTTDE